MTKRLPKRAGFLCIQGVGYITFGTVTLLSGNSGPAQAFALFPYWANYDEVAIVWALAGIISLFVGITQYLHNGCPTKAGKLWERVAFTALTLPAALTAVVTWIGYFFLHSSSSGTATVSAIFAVLAIHIAGWEDPKAPELRLPVPPETGIIDTIPLDKNQG